MTEKGVTQSLLGAGVILTPVFFTIIAVLALVNEGFDLRKQAVSALSLGPLGWIQQANFVIGGVLALFCAAGFWRSLDRGGLRWFLSSMVSLLGLGLALAGFFSTDPAFGFPKGAPDGFPAHPSPAATIHSLAFYTAFTALMVAGLLSSALFWRMKSPGWASYSLVSSLMTPLLIGLGMTVFILFAGIAFALAALTGLGWLSLMARKLQTNARKEAS